MGYPNGIKGYIIYHLEKEDFIISRNVVFKDNIYQFKLLKEKMKPNNKDNIHTIFESLLDNIFKNSEERPHNPKNIENITPQEASENNKYHTNNSNFQNLDDFEDNHPDKSKNDFLANKTNNNNKIITNDMPTNFQACDDGISTFDESTSSSLQNFASEISQTK